MWDFFRSITRTARKLYRCEECRGEIPLGDRYSYNAGKVEGELSVYRLCLPCDVISTELVQAFDDYPDGFPLGECRAELRERGIDDAYAWAVARRAAREQKTAPSEPSELERLRAEVERLRALLNSPEVADFLRGVELEAAHQVERWGVDHDAGKTPFDWFWLIGFLAQKAASAAVEGGVDKARHHAISTAAALANWHRALSGGDNRMRPGIAAPRAEGEL